MNNTRKLTLIFSDILGMDEGAISDELTYNSVAKWDSVAHMALVAEIDDRFDIMLDTVDVINLDSFAKAKEILSKYGIRF
ncbi:acyl carrier protein [Robertmurraya sp. GLU-23]